MKALLFGCALVLGLAATAMPAQGCNKGALIGGIAGHHGVLGAAAGCIAGRHLAKRRAMQNSSPEQTHY